MSMKRMRGLTLIEVLIGTTLVALVSIGMLSVVMFYSQNVARSNVRQDAEELSNLLFLTLANDDLCIQAMRDLGTFTGTRVSINNIYDGLPPGGGRDPIVSVATRYGSHIWVREIAVENVSGGAAPTPETINLNGTPQTLTAYNANVVIDIANYTASINVSRSTSRDEKTEALAPLTIPLKVYTDATGAVARCLVTVANNQTCDGLGGTYDHSAGSCVFPVCDSAVAMGPRGAGDCPSGTGANCSSKLYFWGLVQDGTGPTRLACICSVGCGAPTPSPGPRY